MLEANPTGVNPFNGLSDDSKAAAVAQSLWDRGAFNPDGKPDPAQGQKAPEPAPAAPKAEAPKPEAAAKPTEPAEPAEGASDDAPEFADLDDYLTKAGLERDSFLSLPVKLKVDGKEERATLQELLKSAQLERHVTQKSQQFAEQQKAWETQRQQAQAALQQQVQQATQLSQIARNQLYSDYQNIDWSKFSAEEQLQIDRNFRQRDAQIQQQLAQIQSAQQQTYQQQIQAEQARMLEAIPEWREPTALQAGQKAISEYARERGFTPAELSQIADHRYMLVLRDAMTARDLQAQVDTLKAQLAGKTDAALKLVRQAPKAPNPGARITRDPKVAQLQQARERFSKNPRDIDAQAAMAQRLVDLGA